MAIAERVTELVPKESLKPVRIVQICYQTPELIRIESVNIGITDRKDQIAAQAIFNRQEPQKALSLEDISNIVFFAGHDGGYRHGDLNRLARICTPGASYESALFIGGPDERPYVLTEAQVVVIPLNQPEFAGTPLRQVREASASKHKSGINGMAEPCGGADAMFQQLFHQYEQPIYQHVYRMIGNSEDARDFVQEVFLKAYRALPEVLERGNFRSQAWLYKIATNICLDELRHRKLVKWQPWEAFISFFHPSQVAGDNPEREVMRRETKEEVEAVLAKMPPRYRNALILREYYGLGYDEIAQVLGTSRPALKFLIARARQSFRLCYAKIHIIG